MLNPDRLSSSNNPPPEILIQGKPLNYHRPLLYPKQEEAIFYPTDVDGYIARFSFIEAATKSGKTVGCIAWLLEQAQLGKTGNNYWWIAPVYPQAKIAFTRMKQYAPKDYFIVNETNQTLTLKSNGTIIWFKSGEKPDNLYGEDVFAAVVDEASRVREEAWWAIRSTLTATRGPVRFIGNVKGRGNWFYKLAHKAKAGQVGSAYYKIVAADAVAGGVLNADEIEDARRDLPEHVFKELYLAEPSDDGGNPFGLKRIENCLSPGLSTLPPVVWGWDLAKSIDWTVGTALDAFGAVCRHHRWQKLWNETIDDIISITGNVPALVDSTGVGDPILEMLQARKPGIFEGYLFNGPSKQRLMEGLSVVIQSKATSFPDGVLREELDIFEYEHTRTGVRYTAPEGYHDDCVCSLALAHMHKGAAHVPLIDTSKF